MIGERESNTAEKLMGALISKMENMDSDLQQLKQENMNLRKAVADPMNMLKKAGFVVSKTQRPSGMMEDDFRPTGDDILMKGDGVAMPNSNAEFHDMEWSDIHALADQAKSTRTLGNNMGME